MHKNIRSDTRPLHVILGSQTIKAFVAASREFKVIGIVRMGMEFGLLAVTASGDYVRVNGSTVQPLNYERVECAIALACATGRGESFAATRNHNLQALPSVVIRKRRHMEPHQPERAAPVWAARPHPMTLA